MLVCHHSSQAIHRSAGRQVGRIPGTGVLATRSQGLRVAEAQHLWAHCLQVSKSAKLHHLEAIRSSGLWPKTQALGAAVHGRYACLPALSPGLQDGRSAGLHAPAPWPADLKASGSPRPNIAGRIASRSPSRRSCILRPSDPQVVACMCAWQVCWFAVSPGLQGGRSAGFQVS